MNGLNGTVSALAVSGSTLYAGGYFTTAGGIAANYIAQWNGSSWSALGSGMNGYVSALAVSGSTLYAGGNFTTAGGSAANYIAQWNGSSWSALGSGMNGYVSALAVSGSTLYAGGYFTTAGGNAANYIAQWNGSSWSALGSGMGGSGYLCVCAGGVGQHVVCGRRFHDGGRHRGQLHRAMEREQLVGPRVRGWEQTPMCLRWRCRAARCMRAAISRRRAAARPITSRNGTGAVGRPSVRGLDRG